jgi:hypothetical protein
LSPVQPGGVAGSSAFFLKRKGPSEPALRAGGIFNEGQLGYKSLVQTILKTSLTPVQYVEQEHHKQVRPPENCPNCSSAQSLEALTYYERYVTWLTSAVLIWVRRFLCRRCRVSVSCLPSFAQPYRAISTSTIETGFNAQIQKRTAPHWDTILRSYWRRYESHLPKLLEQVGSAFGRVPLQLSGAGFWKQLLGCCGGLAQATEQLVHEFHTCLLGTYRCHQRRPLHTE